MAHAEQQLEHIFSYLNNQQIDSAEMAIKQLLENAALKPPEDSLVAYALHRIGGFHNWKRNYEAALTAYHQSLGIRENIFDPIHPDIALSYNMIGSVHYKLAAYRTALPFLKKSLEIYHGLGDNDIAYVHYDIGTTYEKQGDYKMSLNHSKKAILFFEAKGNRERNIADSYILIGNNYDNLQNYEAAKVNFEKALQLHQELNNERGIRQSLNNLGNVYLKIKNYNNALDFYNQALQLNLQKEDTLEIANNHSNIGIVYKHLKQYQKAFQSHQSAIHYRKNLDESQRHRALANSYDNIADVWQEQLRFDSAQHYYQKAILLITHNYNNPNPKHNPNASQLENSPNKTDLLIYLTDKANCLKKAGQPKAALNTFHAADQLVDFMRKDHTSEATKLFWRKTTHPTYQAALEICYELKDAREAFYFMEKSRSALLLDQLKNYTGAESHIPKIEETLYDDLLQVKETDFIEFFVGEANIFILKPDVEEPIFLKIDRTADFDNSLLTFIENLKNSNIDFEQYRNNASDLYSTLIKPLNLKHQKLIIIRDGYFNYLPFETLITQNSELGHPTQQAYLGFQYSISYDYSAAIVLKNRLPKPVAMPSFLTIAPIEFPNFNFKLPSLTNQHLLKQLKSYFFNNTILEEDQATKTGFMKRVGDFNVITLITHAVSNNDLPRIYFREDSLTLPELYELKSNSLQADLVVLSACETGIGKLQEGEGVMSLSRGFAYSGVPSTIATLWKANEQSTNKIIGKFYDYLNQKLPKDEALQRAKIDYMQEAAQSDATSMDTSPYAWAALVCVGDTQPLNYPLNYWWLFGIFALIGLVFFYFRTKGSIRS